MLDVAIADPAPLLTSIYNLGVNTYNHLRLSDFRMTLKWKREQHRSNKRTDIERLDWFVERKQTRVAFGWLIERSAEKTSCLKNFLEINRYFAFTLYCNTIGQSNNTFPILGFSFAGNEESMFWSFHPLAYKTITNTYQNYFSRSYENRSTTEKQRKPRNGEVIFIAPCCDGVLAFKSVDEVFECAVLSCVLSWCSTVVTLWLSSGWKKKTFSILNGSDIFLH